MVNMSSRRVTGEGGVISLFVYIWMSLMVDICHGARILVIPLPLGSHIMTMAQISSVLIDNGHEVHAIINKDCKGIHRLEAVGATIYRTNVSSGCYMESTGFLKNQMEMRFKGNLYASIISKHKSIQQVGSYIDDEADALLNEKVTSDLSALKFDLCILNGLGLMKFMFVLPYKLNVPIVAVNGALDKFIAGIPALPSFIPHPIDSTYTHKMTYPQRVRNLIKVLVTPIVISMFFPGNSNGLVTKYAPEKPYVTLNEIVRSTKLWLYLNDIVMDYPQVSLPHTIDIGGLNTRPAEKLPQELQTFADGAKDGLIIVSFGTLVGNFPTVITEMLYEDFRALKQRVIWRYNGPPLKDVPSNIKIMDWIPQNDLLGHPNVKVFVTHCGANSQFEALYHGVPMIGIPLGADQTYNAGRMVAKDMGVRLELSSMVRGNLTAAVGKVLDNSTYRENMRRFSAIFKDRPLTPRQRAGYWLEHVLKYGTDHLRSSAIEMPAYQYWCLDALIPLILLCITLVYLLINMMLYVTRLFYKCFCRSRSPLETRVKEKAQ